MDEITRVDGLIDRLEAGVREPRLNGARGDLVAGVDLGTAYVVVAVVDEDGTPVTARYTCAEVVRDGLVMDFMGAVEITRRLRAELEEALGRPLRRAAGAYPPGTGRAPMKAVRYVCESGGFEVAGLVDEPTAANEVLGIQNGAVVDIGGGTTGIAVIRDGTVVYTADEPTGGTHFTLVIAGARKIPYSEAEEIKTDPRRQAEIMPLVKPVVQKVATIIKRHTGRHRVETIYLVGGASCLEGIERVIEEEVGIATVKPRRPLWVTPLGIAMSACERRVRS